MQIRNVKVKNYTNPIAYGDTCHVTVTFEYMSEEYTTVRLYATIGNNHVFGIFDPIIAAEAIFDLSAKSTWHTVTAVAIIPVTTSISDSGIYDIYAKVQEYPRGGWIESPVIVDAIWFESSLVWANIIKIGPNFSGEQPVNVSSTPNPEYKDGNKWYFRRGTTITFTAEPDDGYTFVEWEASKNLFNGSNKSFDNPVGILIDSDISLAVSVNENVERILEVEITGGPATFTLSKPYNRRLSETKFAYDYGTSGIKVTGFPEPGYRFEKWTGERISGLYDNPALVDQLIWDRKVTLHIRPLSEDDPYEPGPGDPEDPWEEKPPDYPGEEPEGPGEGSTSEFPWSWVALGAGALAVIIGITGIKPRNLNSTPHKETRKDR